MKTQTIKEYSHFSMHLPKCTFLQRHLVLLSTATPTGPENIQKKTRLKYPQSLTNLPQNTVGWEAREKENKSSILKFQNKSKTNISSSIIANFLQYNNISVCCTKCVMFIIRVHKRKICISSSLSPPQPHLSYLIEAFRSYWSFQLADYFLLSNP